ncbi:MAG: FecCD family ABC transporter permease [Planctomycetota bacterium]
MRARERAILIWGLTLVVASVGIRLFADAGGFGAPDLGLELEIRAFRVAHAIVVGASLSVSGVLLQSLLRNPLAAPSLLGLTSGAGFGVMVAMLIGSMGSQAVSLARPPIVSAFGGSFGALALVYVLAQRRGMLEPMRLLLMGVILSLTLGAASMLVQHLMPNQSLALTMRWLLGSLHDDVSTGWSVVMIVVSSVCVVFSCRMGRAMDVAQLSDDEARTTGLALERLRLMQFVMAGVLTSCAVALAGPVAFVGLICPHAARLVVGGRHRQLILLAAMFGATLVLLSDAGIRMAATSTGRMPLGVLTSLIGGPVFVVMLLCRGGIR